NSCDSVSLPQALRIWFNPAARRVARVGARRADVHPDDTGLQPDAVLRATSDPVRRFGPPDRTGALAGTSGEGWTTSSWSAPEAAGVHQLHHQGG
ncbi:hypothetical protein, partial [Kitasatospora sp. NPDC005751]|uniref:hypothetical protein n=1 Tax=Kitasatospora sp. NPDC005751 TaxID=3157064 RepID=UPI0033DEE9B7